jgi:hypothetical protein
MPSTSSIRRYLLVLREEMMTSTNASIFALFFWPIPGSPISGCLNPVYLSTFSDRDDMREAEMKCRRAILSMLRNAHRSAL